MASIYLESLGVIGKIESTDEEINQISKDNFTFHYIPNVQIINCLKSNITVLKDPSLNIPKIKFPYARIPQNYSLRETVSVAEYLMEGYRQRFLGDYSISSSSVYKNGKGVLFFGGATNLGKSTFALDLTKSGFNLFSDEKTVIHLEEAIMRGGSKSVSVRKKILKEKLKCEDEFKNFEYNKEIYPSLDKIILPHIDHGLDVPIIYEFDKIDLFWHLTNEFSRRIRGNTRLVNNFSFLLPSIETDSMAEERLILTKKLVNKVKGYYFQGDSSQIVEFLNKRFN
jgi:hypothetical protein